MDKPSGLTNVWARELENDAFALVFLNNGPTAVDVTCDQSCFANIDIHITERYSVEDLWDETNTFPDIRSATFTAKNLEPSGGHLMIKITPKN